LFGLLEGPNRRRAPMIEHTRIRGKRRRRRRKEKDFEGAGTCDIIFLLQG
jgi:hypothetical protein